MLSPKTAILAVAYLSCFVASAPVRREVPQEHSHEPILTSVRQSLNLNNPDGIVDVVFGLLGNAAGSAGLGKLKDPDCLQQSTADQAFTNAKKAGDVQGQVNALIFRALERNTGKVGLASVQCTSVKAVNPEIAAIQQHQDPASANAAATNKAIVLELAKQIAAVGGNPQDALKSGTFKPGNLNDNTAKGNTCDDANDKNGCIFSQNLLVPDATADEIKAAVAGVNAGGAGSGAASSDPAATATATADPAASTVDAPTATCPSAVTVTVQSTVTVTAAAGAQQTLAQTSAAPAVTATSAAGGKNLQTFTGSLGGVPAPPVTIGGRGFVVAGSLGDFLNIGAALGRSCDEQHNACANAVNSGKVKGITVGQCDQRDSACKAA